MYNKIILIGNLTKDCETKYLPNGTSITNFTLAVNTKYSDKEEVLFISVVVFGKLAENVSKYLSKGSQCLVEGRLVERKWQSDGQEKRRMEVVASTVKFIGKKKESEQNEEVPEMTHNLEPF